MKKAAFVLAILTCSLFQALFTGCNRSNQHASTPAEKVTIAIAAVPETVLPQVALAQGLFAKHGLKIESHVHAVGKAALEEVMEGKADFATVAVTPVMLAAMRGETPAIVTAIQHSRKNIAIVAKKDRGVLTPSDLKDKRIAVTAETAADFFLSAFLAGHGISRKMVTIIDMKPPAIEQALMEGKVDAASIFVPYLPSIRKHLGDNGSAFYDEDGYRETFTLVTTQEYVKKFPDRVEKMLRALIDAEEFVRLNQPEAQQTVVKFIKSDSESVLDGWSANTFAVGLDQTLVLALEDESEWAIRNGMTKTQTVPNYLNYIYLDGLKSIKPDAVRILK